MADTVDTKVIRNGKLYIINLQNRSDGTGETNVRKVDLNNTLLSNDGKIATYSSIWRIEYSVFGFSQVRLDWQATVADEIATMSGNGLIDWSLEGGNVDPRSAGFTGDILLSTLGAVANAGYDITVWMRLKA